MGWCSATEIIDWAIQMTDEAVSVIAGEEVDDETQERIDNQIRPFVAALATKLHNEDWDCEQDSDYFDRFQQEMLGYDDREYARWLGEQLADERDPDRLRDIAAKLEKISQAASNGR